MEISYSKGILIRNGSEKLLLDPEISKTPLAIPTIISHAHSDHTAAMSGSCDSYLTPLTLDLYEIAQNKRTPRNIKTHEFYEPFEIGNFQIEFIKAGHLLGAAQIVVRQGNETIHFSGDFCPAPLLTVEAADIPKDVDISILDATYGDEGIVFDDRVESRQQLYIWVIGEFMSEKIPTIHCAHLGAAQELIKLFNKLSPETNIFVHPKISTVNKVYQQAGISLIYQDLDKLDQATSANKIILLPRSAKTIEYLFRKYPDIQGKSVRGIVTGQVARFGFHSFKFSSNLSTHASHVELMDTAMKIQPSQILTYYGYPDKLAYSINVLCDIPAMKMQHCQNLEVSMVQSRKTVTSNSVYPRITSTNKIWEDWFEE